MSLTSTRRKEIIKNILIEIKKANNSPIALVSAKFGISRQTAYKYLSILIDEGYVQFHGIGRHKQYNLVEKENGFVFKRINLEEDVVWRENIKPLLQDIPDNVLIACNYGFTEMLNNAIDHSGSDEIHILIEQDALSITFYIIDDGIGIFKKIQLALNLDNPKHAILELAKGKLTTDPTRHSGEGIFFTSRIFDEFYIGSGNLQFISGRNGGPDYLFDDLVKKEFKGTGIVMEINKDSDVVIGNVFDHFTAKGDDTYGFSKTHIPVRLVEIEGEALVSRSQAKRLIRRFERFREVVLDFAGVREIGQAFADELFRVFKVDNPQVELLPINMSDNIRKMVYRITENIH